MFDEQGAYVEVRNQKGNPVQPDYLNYSGVVRSILKSMNAIIERSDFLVDWENPENKVYLHENDFLIEQLLQSQRWVDSNGNTLKPATGSGLLSLVMNYTSGENISSLMQLLINDAIYTEFIFINEAHIYSNGIIAEVASVGRNFKAPFMDDYTLSTDDGANGPTSACGGRVYLRLSDKIAVRSPSGSDAQITLDSLDGAVSSHVSVNVKKCK